MCLSAAVTGTVYLVFALILHVPLHRVWIRIVLVHDRRLIILVGDQWVLHWNGATGGELFAAGQEQVGRSHDDGETGMAIADCLSVVSRALLESSLPDPEKKEEEEKRP